MVTPVSLVVPEPDAVDPRRVVEVALDFFACFLRATLLEGLTVPDTATVDESLSRVCIVLVSPAFSLPLEHALVSMIKATAPQANALSRIRVVVTVGSLRAPHAPCTYESRRATSRAWRFARVAAFVGSVARFRSSCGS